MGFTSTKEIRDIIIATLVLAFAFSRTIRLSPFSIDPSEFLPSLLIVGLGFILHELAHKFVAQKYGFFAEFRMWTMGLLLAVAGSFIGFIFAAPGAVYIAPTVKGKFAFTVHRITQRENGLISVAGAVVNIIIASAFFALGFFVPGLKDFALQGTSINFFLAAFNLLPIPPLDGSKVFSWNKIVWAASIGIAAIGWLFLRF